MRILCVCAHVCACIHACVCARTCEEVATTCRSQLSLSIMWILEIKLRSSSMAQVLFSSKSSCCPRINRWLTISEHLICKPNLCIYIPRVTNIFSGKNGSWVRTLKKLVHRPCRRSCSVASRPPSVGCSHRLQSLPSSDHHRDKFTLKSYAMQ